MALQRRLGASVPPGVSYLTLILSTKFLPIVGSVYVAITVLEGAFALSLPRYITWTAVTAAVALVYIVQACMFEVKKRRRAKALGASLAPVWKGSLPGNYDVLMSMLDKVENGYIAEPLWDAFAKHGNLFNLRIFWIDQLFTVEPEHVKQILATEFNNFEKGPVFKYAMNSVLGTGVFNADGDMWKFHRAMTRPFFSRDRISDFELFARHADVAVARIAERLREGCAVDFQDAVARFTLDSATEFLFGTCLNSLDAGLPYPMNHRFHPTNESVNTGAERFARAFADAQWDIATRLRVGALWPVTEMKGDRTKAPMEVVNAYLDPILKEALEKKKAYQAEKSDESARTGEHAKEEITDDETLLDHLVKQTDDPVILKDETLNILIAGRDTTASTLTFAVYLLAQHPHALQRLRAEILETLGTDRVPTIDDIRKMKFLRAVINETLRLYPAVPFNIRTAINETTFPPTRPGGKPIYVPPGTSVTYSVFVMHRRTDLWGPDAMEFDPDRFIDDRLHKYLTPNPFIFLPFNAGPRICLGQQFAYNEASFMLVRLFQKFDEVTLDKSVQPDDSVPPADWRDVPGRQSQEEIFPKSHLTVYVHKGLWVRMREGTST